MENVVYSTYAPAYTPTNQSGYANLLTTTKLGRPNTAGDGVVTFSTVPLEDNGASLLITGSDNFDIYVGAVDANTVLAFDFSSSATAALIQSIGLDPSGTSLTWADEFQLAGTNTTNGASQIFNDYSSAEPGVKHYVIPIGELYAAGTLPSLQYLWLVNQVDGSGAWAKFSNIHFFEATAATTTSYSYQSDGSLTMVTDADGNKTTYAYPASSNRGLPTSMTTPDGYGKGDGSYTTTDTYNNAGQMTSQSTRIAAGQFITQSWHYDGVSGSRGYLTSSVDGNGNTTTYTYDVLGDMLTETQPDPDGSGPLTAPVTISVYDAAGNLLSASLATASPQRTASTVYDKMGRVIETINPDGTYTTDGYDAAGNLVASTDAMGRVTQYIYNCPRLANRRDSA